MFAATPEDAEMEFQYSDSGYCNGGRFEGMSKWLHGHAFKLAVQGKNLQSFLNEKYPQLVPGIRYVKIDTEGYEPAVLQSLSGLISRCKPFMKWKSTENWMTCSAARLYRSIAAYGYKIHKIAEDGNYFGEILTEQDLSKWRHFDIFCAPR